MSVQYVTEASQKDTCPTVTEFPLAVTVAVSDTTLPEAIDPPGANVLPPEVTARVVVVAAGAAQARRTPPQKNTVRNAEICNDRLTRLIFKLNLQFLFLLTRFLSFGEQPECISIPVRGSSVDIALYRAPDATIGNIILVYRGSFDVPLLAGEMNAAAASTFLRQGRVTEGLTMAQAAAQRAPDSAEVNAVLGQALLASHHVPEGRQAIATTLQLAQTKHREYQKYLIAALQQPARQP